MSMYINEKEQGTFKSSNLIFFFVCNFKPAILKQDALVSISTAKTFTGMC